MFSRLHDSILSNFQNSGLLGYANEYTNRVFQPLIITVFESRGVLLIHVWILRILECGYVSKMAVLMGVLGEMRKSTRILDNPALYIES